SARASSCRSPSSPHGPTRAAPACPRTPSGPELARRIPIWIRTTPRTSRNLRMKIPIERYTLENGLRVVLSEDHRLPVVAVNLWYDVGSRDERPGRTGFAHLFEHMMFQGSQHVSGTEHIAHIERVGGSMN